MKQSNCCKDGHSEKSPLRKAVFQKGHLTQHLMIHSGGRPHQCNLCQKTFIFKFDLNRHMKIHAERAVIRADSVGVHSRGNNHLMNMLSNVKRKHLRRRHTSDENRAAVSSVSTDFPTMAQSLIAQQQQRALAALFARHQAAQLPPQPAAPPPPPPPAPTAQLMPSLFLRTLQSCIPEPAGVRRSHNNNVAAVADEAKLPVLAPVNPIKTDPEEVHVNILSTATNSSCSSSPQETSSTAFAETSPSNTEEVTASPHNESMHSPPSSQAGELSSKHEKRKHSGTKRSSQIHIFHPEFLFNSHVVTTTGQLLNQCSPDNVFIAHTKNIFAQLQNSICSSE
ncbi:zinc finger, C2H2 type [Ostertagia ostertagi]